MIFCLPLRNLSVGYLYDMMKICRKYVVPSVSVSCPIVLLPADGQSV